MPSPPAYTHQHTVHLTQASIISPLPLYPVRMTTNHRADFCTSLELPYELSYSLRPELFSDIIYWGRKHNKVTPAMLPSTRGVIEKIWEQADTISDHLLEKADGLSHYIIISSMSPGQEIFAILHGYVHKHMGTFCGNDGASLLLIITLYCCLVWTALREIVGYLMALSNPWSPSSSPTLSNAA